MASLEAQPLMLSSDQAGTIPSQVEKVIDSFICPVCGGPLQAGSGCALGCETCGRSFSCEGGIPRLFWPNEWTDGTRDVTEVVKSFYEETPFPNYDDVDSAMSLVSKAEQGVFTRMLNEQIPLGSVVLEAGCGTGQLSNYLGIGGGRRVFGTDICMNSLQLAEAFRSANEIGNSAFLQMNLFRPCFRDETFDLVVCNGVLHHTSDPKLGFQTLARLVKRGGFLVVGLYNTLGRIPTDLRRMLFRISGTRLAFLDPRIRGVQLNEARRQAWFMDQYRHPHESKHTLGQVLRWFDENGLSFVHGVPPLGLFQPFSAEDRLFEAHSPGSPVERFFNQLGMLLAGGREGGFFIMIGQRDR